MKFSDTLAAETKALWDAAAEKPFVRMMAQGTLDPERFRVYMLQDYLYLLDYIEILKNIRALAETPSMTEFLDSVIEETEAETFRVHVPNMKKIGISDEDILNCKRAEIFTDYVSYMRQQLEEEGFLAGMTAMLQCSWAYAYIGEKAGGRNPAELAASPYKSWFDAYTCPEYVQANQNWIDALDREASGITGSEAGTLRGIFRTCAEYENRIWDALLQQL